MTVKQLKQLLQDRPDNQQVYLHFWNGDENFVTFNRILPDAEAKMQNDLNITLIGTYDNCHAHVQNRNDVIKYNK